MRIRQGYVSKSIMDFPFHEVYRLDDYNNWEEPSVFFGMYRYEDLRLSEDNKADKIIFWTGQDALDCEDFPRGVNVTAHINIYKLFMSLGLQIKLVKPAAFLNTVSPQVLGPKIYAYCPSSSPDYHGKKLIDQLRCGGYEIVIGDGRHSQQEWKHIRNGYYNDIFIGLCLSEFAGGGGSIIEMGLRGINVVTNVFDLPNCKPFKCVDDIAYIIEEEKKRIGTVNEQLANDVWNDLDHEFNWLEI